MKRSVDIDRFSFYTSLTSLVFLALLPSLFPCALLTPIFAYFVYVWFQLFGQFVHLSPREYNMGPSTVSTPRIYMKRSPPKLSPPQTVPTPIRKENNEKEEVNQMLPQLNVVDPNREEYGRQQQSMESSPSPQPTQMEESSSSSEETMENSQPSSNDSEDADQLVKEALKPPMNDHPRELRDEEKESSGSPPDPSEGSNRASNVSVKFIQVQAKRVD